MAVLVIAPNCFFFGWKVYKRLHFIHKACCSFVFFIFRSAFFQPIIGVVAHHLNMHSSTYTNNMIFSERKRRTGVETFLFIFKRGFLASSRLTQNWTVLKCYWHFFVGALVSLSCSIKNLWPHRTRNKWYIKNSRTDLSPSFLQSFTLEK